MLSVDGLAMRFGGLTAIEDVSLRAARGAITAIIGPNGAGKTTLFNCLTGFYRPSQGRITLEQGDVSLELTRLSQHQIADRARVARTFQNIRLFPRMSVLENLIVAQHNQLMRSDPLGVGAILGLPCYRAAERAAVDLAKSWLHRVGLTDKGDRLAGDLAYGQQRRVEIARAMCTKPVLLCLDEPAAGLNARESAELNLLLAGIRDRENVGILLIEHDMSVVMNVSDHVVVLDHGRKIAEGDPAAMQADPAVIAAYLGADFGKDRQPAARP